MSVRVLLVDDREDARAGLSRRLSRSQGIELLAAVGDAGEVDPATSERSDLVLVDLHGTEGEDEVLSRQLSRAVDAPLVAMASFMTGERWRRLRQVGVAGYVLRHVDSQQLAATLVRLSHQLKHARP